MKVSAITVGIISALSGCTVLLTLACFPTMMWKEKRNRSRNPESRESISASSTVSSTTITTTATTTTATTASTTAEPGVRGGKEINTYVHMVCMLALSDVLSASAYALGYPTSRSVCIAQGVLMLFFQRAKWIWNTLIVYQLYRFMVRDVRGLTTLEMHALCWSACILFEVLPLFDGVSYGVKSTLVGKATCYYNHGDDTVTIT